MKQKNQNNVSGVVLLAKQSGRTSFQSLFDIKHALNTDKVGHTGTLDSFADGLLVVLTGHITHLVPHITGFSKTYRAVVCFGKETDTLDPEGNVIKTGNSVRREQVADVLKEFTGALLQKPPAFSALHVNGKRASDLVRNGEQVNLEPRQIFIYQNLLVDFLPASDKDSCSYALLEITCSKGTYIRSLARDISERLGTCGHLIALRRTKVGPFRLEDAACYSFLEEFSISNALKKLPSLQQSTLKNNSEKISDHERKNVHNQIKDKFLLFTKETASTCGFYSAILKKENEESYLNGRPLKREMFDFLREAAETQELIPTDNSSHNESYIKGNQFRAFNKTAVFYNNGLFAGIIEKIHHHYKYGFVVPKINYVHPFKVFTWDDVVEGKFPVQLRLTGTALTVGCFDGIHLGHKELISCVIGSAPYYKGIIALGEGFKESSSGSKILSNSQKINLLKEEGLDFAILVDYSEKFAMTSGVEFLEILCRQLGMKFLAEGTDFKCGYKGEFSADKIDQCAGKLGFEFKIAQDVLFEGKKISSTLIKQKIVQGKLLDVQKMLGRPYQIDLSHYNEQVLPPDGQYKCIVLNSTDNKNSIFETSCWVEGGNLLKLTDSFDIIDHELQFLQFIPQV